MSRGNFPVFSVILYVLGVLVLAYGIWASFYSFNFISTMMGQGQLVFSGNEFEIVSFHMTTFGQYIIYATILIAIGWIIQMRTFDRLDYEDLDYEEDEVVEGEVAEERVETEEK
jgi:hypothetical protein